MIKKYLKKRAMIFLFEIIFVFGILGYVFFTTAPTSNYPLSGMTISEDNFKFEIENGEKVLISSNENFSNLIILKEEEDITLPAGTYYWKVKNNLRESEVKNFTISTTVALDIEEKENVYELQNSGSVDLNVTEKNNSEVVGNFLIKIGENIEVENESIYEGRQND